MDKKLIKQLKSVGFEYDKSFGSVSLKKQIEGTTFYYNAYKFILLGGNLHLKRESISNPTFEQIIKAIKEHTGVDLTPKKSKREEIEELKTKVASLEDAIKSQNKAIEELNISIKARGRICLKDTLKQEGTFKEQKKKAFKVGDSCVN